LSTFSYYPPKSYISTLTHNTQINKSAVSVNCLLTSSVKKSKIIDGGGWLANEIIWISWHTSTETIFCGDTIGDTFYPFY